MATTIQSPGQTGNMPAWTDVSRTGPTTGTDRTRGTTAPGNMSGTVPAGGTPLPNSGNGFILAADKPAPPPVPTPVGGGGELGTAGDELAAKVEAFLASGSKSAEDAQLLLDALNNRMLALSAKLEGSNSKTRQGEIEANGKKREAQIQEAAEKAKKVEEKGFWAKLWGIVKAVASVVGAAAMVVAGAALTAVSGPAGAIVAGIGAYMLIGAVGELVKEVIVAAGGERPSWSLTLGYAAAQIAKAAVASEDTQMWLQLGVDIAVTVVAIGVSMLVPGMQAKALQKIGDVTDKIQKMTQLAKVANGFAAASNVVSGAAMIGQGVNTIQIAQLTFDEKSARAELASLQALYDMLMSFLEQSGERMKQIQETQVSIWENAGERLDTIKKTNLAVWRPQAV